MRCANNAVIMQTKQLGCIETLKEKLHASEGWIQELEHKLVEQDHVIANLVGDNFEHLQDNMYLTTHINSTSMRFALIEEWLGQVGAVVLGIARGALEGLSMEGFSLEARMSDASGDDQGDQDGGVGSGGIGASPEGSTRVGSPMLREGGLIVEMEREAMEAGAGGWFNRNLEDVLESWSGRNSVASSSQDRVWTTTLTTIGSHTLPSPVRVPDNITQPAILRSLMEGPVRLWQCLVWAEASPPLYTHDLPPLHLSGPSHVLLQVSLYYEDIDGEYRGGGVIEEEGENEGGGVSIE